MQGKRHDKGQERRSVLVKPGRRTDSANGRCVDLVDDDLSTTSKIFSTNTEMPSVGSY